MKKEKWVGMMLFVSLLTLNLSAYDVNLAQKFNETFSQYSQAYLNHSKMLISADSIMKMLQKKEDFVLLDIRTPAEMSVVGLRTKNSVEIPFDQLFKKENLDKLPKDKPLVIVCHSGSRALQAATSLEMLGFQNAKVLYGGIMALVKSDSTKNAPVQ